MPRGQCELINRISYITRCGATSPGEGYHYNETRRTSCNGRVGRMHLRLVRAFKRCRISLSYASTASHSGERGTVAWN